MNIYIVVEGNTEKEIYKSWVSLVNSQLSYVDSISEITNYNYYIISGGGYPSYFEVIDKAIEDVNNLGIFDKLIIAIDSEEMSDNDKYIEINNYVIQKNCLINVVIIVQHFCIETWGLGNRKAIRPHPTSDRLREYMKIYNVRNNDPELLPPNPKDGLNRAQFAKKYLRVALNEKNKHITLMFGFSKFLSNQKYFDQLKQRQKDTNHIKSFNIFLNAF